MWGDNMRVMSFARRYLPPFLSGACAAGACVAGDQLAAVALAIAALGLGYASLPAGSRTLRKIVGATS
jgi:hypothetical protein